MTAPSRSPRRCNPIWADRRRSERMAEPINRGKCRILISNDDGIRSPGIQILEKIARELSDDVWVVAPEQEQSGASHSLTTRRPLRLTEVGTRRYWVDGTPTDCVLLAVKRLLRDKPPDLVLSGINGGSNVGEDLTYSGTVAAAMEATLLGIPSMALSQDYRDGEEPPGPTRAAGPITGLGRSAKRAQPSRAAMSARCSTTRSRSRRSISI